MKQLTAADYADTGQWKLQINLREEGLDAWLKNTIHTDLPPQQLFEKKRDKKEENYLKWLEESVYSYPRLLDDFSTRIKIFDNKTIFLPSEFVTEDDLSEEEAYADLFDEEISDVIADRDKDIVALFNPGKGVKSFLLRTFPGAKITSHLMDSYRLHKNKASGPTLFLDRRDNDSDIILLDAEGLVSASTHVTKTGNDALYHALNKTDFYGYKPEEVKLIWEGKEAENDVKPLLKKFKEIKNENNTGKIRQKEI